MLGFLFLASSQGNFFAQHKGGKPIIPIPPDLVLTYELLILGGVYITVLGFLICAGLPARIRSDLYNTKISEDQIGVMVKSDAHTVAEIKKIFERHHALSIAEEVIRMIGRVYREAAQRMGTQPLTLSLSLWERGRC